MTFFNTKPFVEEPVESPSKGPGGMEEVKTTHPAFAQISVGRVSGHTNLYGSDFDHQNYIVVSIHGSELHRTLSNDWHYSRNKIVEVAMSEAQWATFVSSFNMGSGVPCTLTYTAEQGMIASLPTPKSRSEQFRSEMDQDFSEAIEALDELQAGITASGLSNKKTEALLESVRVARQRLTSSIPFVAEQFSEHMENEVEKAKVEIHGYATNLFQRSGLAALTGETPPVALPVPKDDADA